MDVTRTAAPADPLTAEQLRTQCRVYGGQDDEFLQSLMRAAVAKLESDTGYVLGTGARYQFTAPISTCPAVVLPRYPYDRNRTWSVSVDGAPVGHAVDAGETSLPLLSFLTDDDRPQPRTGFLEVALPVGGLSQIALQAVKLLVGSWYENREATAPIDIRIVPMAYESLISSLKPARSESF